MSWPFHDCFWFLKSLCTSTGCCPAVSADQTVKHFNSKAKETGGSLELNLDKLWGGESSCWSCFCFSYCLQEGIYPATLHRQLQLAIRLFFLSAASKRGRTVNRLLCLLWIMLACCILCKRTPERPRSLGWLYQAGDVAAPALPRVHARPGVQHSLGSTYQGAGSPPAPGHLSGLPCCKSREGRPCSPALGGDAQPAERATGE